MASEVPIIEPEWGRRTVVFFGLQLDWSVQLYSREEE